MNRLDLWPKAFSDAFNLRKSEVRQRDEEEKLTAEDFQAFVDSDKAKDIKPEYVRLADNPNEAVDIMKFAELRDYLLLLVITASGQRCGAAGTLTVQEFRNGVQHSEDLYITKTLRHKTAGGHAKLMWDAQLKRMVNTYLTVLRPTFANDCRDCRHSGNAGLLHQCCWSADERIHGLQADHRHGEKCKA